jgi:hypothetical protein
MVIEKSEIEKIFTEWDRRYRENPEDFMNIVDHLIRDTPYSYGKACASYFCELAKEI